MHRDNLLRLLEEYIPSSKEIKFKKEILSFVTEHEYCFERTSTEGHVTGSAWLIDKEGERVLLMHHAKLDSWLQLGGHADGDSDILAVALKEAKEESGIEGIVPVQGGIFDIDIHTIPANSKDDAHKHYDIRFILQVTTDEDFQVNSESKELRWIPADLSQLPSQEPSMMRMMKKWIGIKRLSK
jgi:8-oxo-dGTP pyrophosphatase MutT (NUDIX family)